MKDIARIAKDLRPFTVIAVLLAGVYLLPPDTSLAEVKDAGTLTVCVPPAYPPLVTGDPAAPGMDVELLRDIAKDLGVTLTLNENAAMGRDFNPRAWRLTRAQCSVIAGGIVDSATTRSFLDVTPPHAETGWAMVGPGNAASLKGKKVGLFIGASGLDRLALSSYLRHEGVTPSVVASATALTSGLADGTFDVVVTEGMLASAIAGGHDGWTATWLPASLPRYPVVFGLWKGDLTLKRAIVAALGRIEKNGRLAAITARYLGAHPILDTPPNAG
jgi:polar amino acid transport system substrate-binding protein/cystine transport system substrate-binding protein/membrane-bound lytic murein transglycosylase F